MQRREAEAIKMENLQLKSITKVDDDEPVHKEEKVYSNYIPLCIAVVVVVGFGIMYKFKHKSNVEPVVQKQFVPHKEDDIFDF